MATLCYGFRKPSTPILRKLESQVLNDWKALREAAGLTLAELAEKSGYSTGTINGLELRGEGSQRLKDKLHEVLTNPALKESVKQGRSESVSSPVAVHDRPREYRNIEQCRERIKELEQENERLRAMVMAAANPRGVSYRKPINSTRASDAEQLLDDAERSDPAGPSKS